MLQSRIAIALTLLLGGCRDDGPSVSAKWARWFSFRESDAVAVSSSGRHVIVAGRSSHDATFRFDTPALPRAWLTILDASGDVVADLSAQTGVYLDVAIDDSGRGYALRNGVADPMNPDAPFTMYQLLALAPDGDERWSMPWDTEDFARIPDEILALSEHVVVRAGSELVAYSSEGELAWTSSLPHLATHRIARRYELWFGGNKEDSPGLDDAERSFAVRCDADGVCGAAIGLGHAGLRLEAFDVDDETIVAHQCEGPHSERICRLAAYSRDGSSLWHHTVDSVGAILIAAGGYWTIGSSLEHDRDETGAIVRDRRHMSLRRHRSGGIDFSVQRTFVEDERDAIDRIDCPSSDVEYNDVVGSHTATLHALVDGGLLVSGRQGCRDSFVLAFEVSR